MKVYQLHKILTSITLIMIISVYTYIIVVTMPSEARQRSACLAQRIRGGRRAPSYVLL